MKIMRGLGISVLEAAKMRIRKLMAMHDHIVVSFSGGKDSLAVLHLVHEVMLEDGDDRPVNAMFMDEELLPESVIDFVAEVRAYPWVALRWYVLPMKTAKFIMGDIFELTEWAPDRPHLREPPPWAILPDPNDKTIYDQHTTGAYIAKEAGWKGRVCFLTGIRVEESLQRRASIMIKMVDSFVADTKFPHIFMGKPIYDWKLDDLLLYFYERKIRYCPIYDRQHVAEVDLRVSTPLHGGSAKRIGLLREYEPEFYGRIMELFPEMRVQERYWAEFNASNLASTCENLAELWALLEAKITPEVRARYLMAKREALQKYAKDPVGYSSSLIIKYFMRGQWKTAPLLPISKNRQEQP